MADSVAATELLHRWLAGDAEAAGQLFQRYSAKLTGLASKHLSDRLARRSDSEDVIQSVFRTFFGRSSRGEFTINSSGELWRLLVTITLAKVRDLARRHTAAKRDIRMEVGGGTDWMLKAFAGEPGPLEAAAPVRPNRDDSRRLAGRLRRDVGVGIGGLFTHRHRRQDERFPPDGVPCLDASQRASGTHRGRGVSG